MNVDSPVENLAPGRFSPVICGQTMTGNKRRLRAMKVINI
jgi:hypothetical protein